uniref:Capsid protein n=1 Tax=Emberiza rustica Genomoviridae sp. TaxID=2814949 RepID=A0A8E7G265_9VIRU
MPRFKNRRSRYVRKRRSGSKRTTRSTRRTTRKTYRRRRPMTNRKILDVTSIKKRDVLLPTSNQTLDPSIPSTALPAILGSGRPTPPRTPAYTYCIPWIPTYRQPIQNASSATYKSGLTTGTPYYKGVSENITISVTGGVPWQWRRICFTYKGPTLTADFRGDLGSTYFPARFYRNTFENDTGIFRPLYDLASYYGDTGGPTTNEPQALGRLYQFLFQGNPAQFTDSVTNTDWINVMTAKTDNRELNIKYDKTVTLQSGNEEGIQRNFRRYHPMERTLVHESFEEGNDTVYLPNSTNSKQGMGDYYIIDFFQARYGSDADSGNLIFDPRATIYWHEK